MGSGAGASRWSVGCRAEIPRPRPGQKACGSKCRWLLWKARRQAAAEEVRQEQALTAGRLEHVERLLGQTRAREGEVRQLLTAALSRLDGDYPTRREEV